MHPEIEQTHVHQSTQAAYDAGFKKGAKMGQGIDIQSIGRGGFGGGFGDGGGLSWVVLLALLGRHGIGHDGNDFTHRGDRCSERMLESVLTKLDFNAKEMCDARAHIAQHSGEIKAQIADRVTALHDRIADAKEHTTKLLFDKVIADNAEHRALDEKICKVREDVRENRHELGQMIVTEARLTRDVIHAQEKATLERRITELEIRDNRHHDDRRARDTEINVSQSVNQNQAQAQQQQQQQQIVDVLRNLHCRLDRFEGQINIANQLAVQSARATQDVVNVGGTLTGVGQSANQANTAVR